ncbi:putative methyltransferase [Luteimicrobium album]|uniref:Methyltransferase n=1 Tax=Luteimicrobium album TaxID=1054550 RepID=A0ABQ6I3X0_9MICO|nr:class I SAM-dependent methyltransferase [Luteimicrobium album]GMA25356.1 putative methyltransferase [Luteimicrobium album]
MTDDERSQRAARAASFEQGAAGYARARPGYPAAAVDWLLDGVGAAPAPARVLDLAAGTGLLTERLVARGLDVVAVDASPAMLAELTARLPTVEAHVGTAESVPLDDGSVDAVLVATAWHWFDEAVAGREIARVLRPGGRLGIVRNDRDTSVDWVAAFGDLLHRGDSLQRPEESFDPHPGAAFGPVERAVFPWTDTIAPSGLRALAGTRSHLLTVPDVEREAILDEVDRLAATHPDLAGREAVALPYVARCVRTDRAA